MVVKHKFVDTHADGADATLVRPRNWNDDHDIDYDELSANLVPDLVPTLNQDTTGTAAATQTAAEAYADALFAALAPGGGQYDVQVNNGAGGFAAGIAQDNGALFGIGGATAAASEIFAVKGGSSGYEFTAIQGYAAFPVGITFAQLYQQGVSMWSREFGARWIIEANDTGTGQLSFIWDPDNLNINVLQLNPYSGSLKMPALANSYYIYADNSGNLSGSSIPFGAAAFKDVTYSSATKVASVDPTHTLYSGNVVSFFDNNGTITDSGIAVSDLATKSYVTGLGYITGLTWAGLTGTPPLVSLFSNDANYTTIAAVTALNYITVSSVTWANLSGSVPAVSYFANDAGYITASVSATFTNKTGNISQWTNDSNYATQSYVTGQGYITGVAWNAITGTAPGVSTFANDASYATQTYVNSQGYLTSVPWNILTGIPPVVSTFSNDASYATQSYVNGQGFITSAGVASSYPLSSGLTGTYAISTSLGGSVTFQNGVVTAWTPMP